jgi:hypothetical protein
VVAGFGGALQLSSFEQPQQEERNSPAADGGCENVKPSTLLVCHDHPRRGGGERLAGALSPRPDRCLCSRASATARVPAWPCVRNASGGGSSPSYAHQHPYNCTSCQVLFMIRGFPSLLRPRASRPARPVPRSFWRHNASISDQAIVAAVVPRWTARPARQATRSTTTMASLSSSA